MLRYIACLAATVLMGAPLCAGELDAEYGTKAPTAPAAKQKGAAPAAVAVPANLTADAKAGTGSELDGETPTQASRAYRGWGGGWGRGWGHGWGHGWGRGWYGGGRGWHHGWRGYGWAGYGWRGLGWRGYGYAPYFSYYPSYISYGSYGYPSWDYCW